MSDTTDTDVDIIRIERVRTLLAEAARDKRPESVLLVDPRSEPEYAQGHLPGARNIQIPSVQPDRRVDPIFGLASEVIVYGLNPGSSPARAMAKRLIQAKVSNVWLFSGGIEEWIETGGAVETGTDAGKAK